MIKIALTNLGKYNEGSLVFEWLELPATEEEIKDCLDSIGINEEYQEYFISDHETDIEGLEIGEYSSIDTLNSYAEQWDELQDYEKEIVSAIMEYDTGYNTLDKAIEVMNDGDYSFYSDINNDEDLGEYVVDEGLFGEVPENLQMYLNYEAIGRDWRINAGGTFVSGGYIEIR